MTMYVISIYKKPIMMRYVVLVPILFFIACSSPVEPPKGKTLEEKHVPYDFDDMKLFGVDPSAEDISYYHTSVKNAKQQIAVRSDHFSDEWTQQGPGNLGGRVNAVAVDPGNDDIIYAGFARGGLWKTIDGGGTWEPLWDDQLTQAVSAITIDPTNSNIVYAGSGDINISGNVYLGNGLFKSEDAGETWINIGLEETKVIGKIIINPTNTNEILVATMGNVRIKDDNRGVYKTTDGGQTWDNVLFVADDTGVHDIVFHPDNPTVILAAAWTRFRNGHESRVSGEDCRVYMSEDFGETWAISDMNIPTIVGRPAITFKDDDPQVAYAMMMNNSHRYISLHKSVDAGKNWTMIDSTNESTPTMMGGFGWFFGRIGAYKRPENGEDRVFLCGVDLWSFNEEFAFWEQETPSWWEYSVHADKHAIITDSNNNLLLGTDGGLYKKEWGSTEWTDIENIPNNMFYRVEVSPHNTDLYYGGMQDNGTTGGNLLDINNYPRLYGGDGFQTRFHPFKPDVQYFETQNGNIYYTSYTDFAYLDFGPMQSDRKNWDMQYILSPHNPDIVYTGTFRPVVFDVTDPYAIIVDTLGPSLTDPLEYISGYHTITSLDESALVEGLLYYGTADGNIWKRQDGIWEQINNGIEKHYVTSIKASPHDEATVYVTLSNYAFFDDSPRIYKSTDYGNTWESIHNNLPSGAVNDIIIYDEFEDKLLFAATNVGVYGSIDGGASWERVGSNIPYLPVNDMVFNKPQNVVVAGTYGRSINTYDLTKALVALDPSSNADYKYATINVYPNPTSDRITVASDVPVSSVEIYTADGRLVSVTNSLQIDVSRMPSGLYYATLKDDDGNEIQVKKWIKN